MGGKALLDRLDEWVAVGIKLRSLIWMDTKNGVHRNDHKHEIFRVRPLHMFFAGKEYSVWSYKVLSREKILTRAKTIRKGLHATPPFKL